MRQRTIGHPVVVSGIGLHSGSACTVELRPSGPGTGIRLFDLTAPTAPPIPVHVAQVTGTRLATTLSHQGRSVQTVEHLLSAVRGLGVDNLDLWVSGPEIPVMDGSAAPFAAAIHRAGVVEQQAGRTVLVVDRPVRIEEGPSWIEARPSEALELQLSIDFDHPLVGEQSLCLTLTAGVFEAELQWARTFGFERDVAAMKRMGLIGGGSLDNALVFTSDGLLNEGGLRQPDEPVRHKAVDMLGDLALLGHPVRGCFRGHRAGHSQVIALVRALLADEKAWHLETSALAP